MTLGNMRAGLTALLAKARQWRALARRVMLELLPPADQERGPVARRHAGADLRPAHGVHPMRHHRHGRAAERQFAAMQHSDSESGQNRPPALQNKWNAPLRERRVNGCEDPRIDGARGNGDEIHRRRIDAI